MSAVHVVGSVNWDLVVAVGRLPAPGETVADGSFSRHPGGKGANQAVAAARAGAAVRMVCAVGTDELGDDALDELRHDGVDVTSALQVEAFPTGVAAVLFDRSGENMIAVAAGANAALDAAAVGQALDGRVGPADVVLVCFEVGDAAADAAAGAAVAAGATLVVNPAPARALSAALLRARPIVTPNAAEATGLTGCRDAEEAAHALAGVTRAPVVVTLGAAGALVLDGDRVIRIPALAGDGVVDTTGAGDTFTGVLAAELALGRGVEEAARAATVAAGLSTRAVGARTAMPTASEIAAAPSHVDPWPG